LNLENTNYCGTEVFRDFATRFVVGVAAVFLLGANAVDRRRTSPVRSSYLCRSGEEDPSSTSCNRALKAILAK
jgi:hypothetical protein